MDAKTFEAIVKQMGINEDFSYGQYLHSVEHSKYSREDIQKVSHYFMHSYGVPIHELLWHQCSNLSKAIQENEFSKSIDICRAIEAICTTIYIQGYFDGRDNNADINPES